MERSGLSRENEPLNKNGKGEEDEEKVGKPQKETKQTRNMSCF